MVGAEGVGEQTVRKFRVAHHRTPSEFYRVVERVGVDRRTGSLLTIEWPECFGTEEGAEAAIEAAGYKITTEVKVNG